MDESIIKRGKIEKIAKMPMMSESICVFLFLCLSSPVALLL